MSFSQETASASGPAQQTSKTNVPAAVNPYAAEIDAAHEERQRRGERVRWELERLTGDPAAVQALADAAGVVVVREGGELRHNLRALVVNAEGRVHAVPRGRDWGAAELRAQLGAAGAASDRNSR